MREIVDKLLASSATSQKSPVLFFEGERVVMPPQERYTSLPSSHHSPRSTLTAIDGGSAILFSSPSACVAFVRLVALTMQSDMRKTVERREGYVIVTVNDEGTCDLSFMEAGGVKGKTEKGKTRKLFTLEAEEPGLPGLVDCARKLLEWELVSEVAKSEVAKSEVVKSEVAKSEVAKSEVAKKNDVGDSRVVVWDGCFTPQNPVEEQALDRLKSKQAGCAPILGLAKTTTMLSTNYAAFFGAAPAGCWRLPVTAGSSFVRLHVNAKHTFRIDALHDSGIGAIESLIPWSTDGLFLGYPYPLVLVDQLARVSNQERAGLLAKFQVAAGEDWARLELGAAATDAHERLDTMQY